MDSVKGMDIQWYPGHMTKTRRQIEADLKQVDAVCEVVDARIPRASRNPDIDSLCAAKPRIIALNRIDLADSAATNRWKAYFKGQGMQVITTDCKSRRGVGDFIPAAQRACAEKRSRDQARGMTRALRVMVVGIPNVGKSTLINQIARRKGAKAENRPGVTRGKQWITVEGALELLDTPGILWPKFEDPQAGLLLAYTGAVKEGVLDIQELSFHLLELLARRYPQALKDRYGIDADPEKPGWELCEQAACRRGFRIGGGEADLERMSRVLLDEFRSGRLGRLTLEEPEEDV